MFSKLKIIWSRMLPRGRLALLPQVLHQMNLLQSCWSEQVSSQEDLLITLLAIEQRILEGLILNKR